MDRKIKKKRWTPKRIFYLSSSGIIGFLIIYYIAFGDKSSKLNVELEKITVETVVKDYYQDYIAQIGTVFPIATIYLDAIEGGRVEEILIEEGTMVKKGEIILRLSNPNLNLSILNTEANLAEQMNFLRNTRLQMEQDKLNIKRQLIELNYQLAQLKRTYIKNKGFYEDQLISEEEYLISKEDYERAMQTKELLLERSNQDSIFRSTQIEHLENNLGRMQLNLDLVQQKLENLNVKAPVSGQLGFIDAEIGEAISQGQRLGQINVLDSYKVQVDIDEYYIDRITTGLIGNFDRSGENYELRIKKVYPEVRNGRFQVDMVFTQNVPENIRTGQTYRLKIELGQSEEAILLPRGGFYQSTGGQWVFIVDASGEFAVKREIKINRQNPKFYEVLEGLEPGERVITSSYDNFGDVDKLVLKK